MISYKKLLHILIDRNLKLTNVVNESGLSQSIVTRLNKGLSVEVGSLEKICLYLRVNIGDVCDIVDDE